MSLYEIIYEGKWLEKGTIGRNNPNSGLIDEGLSNRKTASKLGRPEAGIRDLRYREGLRDRTENETKTFFQQRDLNY